MRALVVYESMFGNTRDIAVAVGEGVGRRMPVDVIEVSDAPSVIPGDVALLVVGAPTHAHGLTKPDTRANAASKAGDRLVSAGSGVREWLDRLASPATLVPVGVFDTRIRGPLVLWGSAAKPAADRLRLLRFRLIREPESFLVDGPTGPMFDRLRDGEVERARAWGEALASMVRVPVGAM